MRRFSAIALITLVGVLVALETAAWACPSCALNHQEGGVLRQLLVAGMLVAPFLVAAGVVFAVRRALR